MAHSASDVMTLRAYVQGVMFRAGHHVPPVEGIALTLLGGIIWRAEPGTMEIKEFDGDLANVLWWESGATGRRYACAYNHHTGEIEIRDRSTQGSVVHGFTNETPVADIHGSFAAL